MNRLNAAGDGAGTIALALHAAIFLLSVIILALAATTIAEFRDFYGIGIGGPGFTIFVCVYTWIICIYVIVSNTVVKTVYNRVIHLGMLALGTIFWLSSWSSMAAWAAAWGEYSNGYNSYGFFGLSGGRTCKL